ncbi:MAG: hypothetical protein ACNA7J_01830 [Wenzhouxiangella sp.]
MRQRMHYRLVGPRPAMIARHLINVFGISPGGALACILAPEGPACNETALRAWVQRNLADLASHPVANVLVVLEERLLAALQAACPEGEGAIEIPSPIALQSDLPHPYWERTDACSAMAGNPACRRRIRRSPVDANVSHRTSDQRKEQP